jgi:antitoxin component of MazEF toxin-antitoxin module
MSTDTEPAAPVSQQARRVVVGGDGALALPSDLLAAIGVRPGDAVAVRVVDGELRMSSTRHALTRFQTWLRSLAPEGVDLVDDLIAERRAEAAHA